MTETQLYLDRLPGETQKKFIPVFGDVKAFYWVMYFIARNEHFLELHKDRQTIEKLDIIHMIRYKVKKMVTRFGLNGQKILADIHKEYQDDYKSNRVREQQIEDNKFLEIVRQISIL